MITNFQFHFIFVSNLVTLSHRVLFYMYVCDQRRCILYFKVSAKHLLLNCVPWKWLFTHALPSKHVMICFTVSGLSRHSALHGASTETELPLTNACDEIPLYFDAQADTIRDIVRDAVSRDMCVFSQRLLFIYQ